MAEQVAEPVEQKTEEFNAAEYFSSRNAAEAAKKAGTPPPAASVKAAEPEKKAEEPKPAADAKAEPRLPRSERRAQNRLREEIGILKGKLEILENMRGGAPAQKAAEDDPEPLRAAYPDDAAYYRAIGKWEARQEAGKVIAKVEEKQQTTQELTALRDHLKAMDEKAAEDMKLIPDWDAVAKAASESEDVVEFKPEDHPQLMAMIAGSDLKAFVLYHFAKDQDDLERFLDLTAKPHEQIKAFHRLEGRLEKEYTAVQQAKGKPEAGKAAQATEETPKDRKHPAEVPAPETGRNTAERDAQLPRPTQEVRARGGSPPPEEPAIGSKAWMARRNQAQYGR